MNGAWVAVGERRVEGLPWFRAEETIVTMVFIPDPPIIVARITAAFDGLIKALGTASDALRQFEKAFTQVQA